MNARRWGVLCLCAVFVACSDDERSGTRDSGDSGDAADVGGDTNDVDIGDTADASPDAEDLADAEPDGTDADATDAADTGDAAPDLDEDALADADAPDLLTEDEPDTTADADADEPEPVCSDDDGDGRGTNCAAGADCDDADGDNWVSCGSCVDLDGDGHHVGCDRYETRSGPDCADDDDFAMVEHDLWPDADFDGFGDAASDSAVVCTAVHPPVGLALVAGDCDDEHPLVYEGALEIPNDEVDNDCAGDGDAGPDDDLGVFVVPSDAGYCLEGAVEGELACPFTDLQAAIDAASEAGVAVFLAGGTYSGPIATDVSLFGGYTVTPVEGEPPLWTREGPGATVTLGAEGGTVIVIDAAEAIAFHRITARSLLAAEAVGISSETGADVTMSAVGVDLSVTASGVGLRAQAEGGTGWLRYFDGRVRVLGTGEAVAVLVPDAAGVTLAAVSADARGDIGHMIGMELGARGPIAFREARTAVLGTAGPVTGAILDSDVAIRADLFLSQVQSNTSTTLGLLTRCPVGGTVRFRELNVATRGPGVSQSFVHQGGATLEIRSSRLGLGTSSNPPEAGVVLQVEDAAPLRLFSTSVALYGASQAAVVASGPAELVNNTFVHRLEATGAVDVLSLSGPRAAIVNNIAFAQEDVADPPPRLLTGNFPGQELRVINNIIGWREGGLLAGDLTTLEALHACEWDGCSAASANRLADPGLLDAFRLAGDSPAIDTGVDPTTLNVRVVEQGPLLDVEVQARPVDAADPEGDGSSDDIAEWDVGAYELVPAPL